MNFYTHLLQAKDSVELKADVELRRDGSKIQSSYLGRKLTRRSQNEATNLYY